MTEDSGKPAIAAGQRWFLPSNARRPARTVHEVTPVVVDYADARGVRHTRSLREFLAWARQYGAQAR